MSKTFKLTLASLLIAIGTLAGNIISIPVGVGKMFPIQSAINILSAVLLGPIYPVVNAFIISLLRNILGTGTLLAFPGSMIGALLAGLGYYYTKNFVVAAVGEVIGTGILGALGAYPIVTFVLGQHVAATFYIIPFLISTLGGSVIAVIILFALKRNTVLEKMLLRNDIDQGNVNNQDVR